MTIVGWSGQQLADRLPERQSQEAFATASHARQVGGDHYVRLAVQPWDAMAAWMSPEAFRGFLRGNAIKYLAREKSPDDLRKARHYLDKLIELEEHHHDQAHHTRVRDPRGLGGL
jgi:hypothetical protein